MTTEHDLHSGGSAVADAPEPTTIAPAEEQVSAHDAPTAEVPAAVDSDPTPEAASPAPPVEAAASAHDHAASAGSEDFAAALETFTTETEEAVGDDHVIKGTVVKLTATQVVVDIGAKSEGMVALSEVLDHEGQPKFKPGDEIDVMRDKGETEEGYIKLSHQKAQRLRVWDDIERAYNDKTPIKGIVSRTHQGRLNRGNWRRARLPAWIAGGPAAHAQPGRHEGPGN